MKENPDASLGRERETVSVPTPLGNSSGPLSRRDTTTMAKRFNAGTGQRCVAPIPKGRLNPSSAGRVPFRPALGRPFGTWGHLAAKPSVETLGYYRVSLRDNGRRPGQGNFRKALVLAGAFHTMPLRPLINTVASARCKKAPGPLQPFQRFAWGRGKPRELSGLGRLAADIHRAEAAVLMRPASALFPPG